MKLNEVLIKNKVVQYNASAPIGNRYIVLDESMNRVISKHATKESAEKQINKPKQIKIIAENVLPLPRPPSGVFPAGQIFPYGMNGYAIGLGNKDEVIRFTDANINRAQAEAQKFLDGMPEADRNDPAKLKRKAGPKSVLKITSFTQGLNRRIAASEIKSFEALEKLPKIGPTLREVLDSSWWRGFGRILAGVGGGLTVAGGLVYTGIGIINDLENEAETDPSKLEENTELRNILVGQISVQVLFILRIIFGNARLFGRALNAIKWTVRAVQAGVAGTGVGAIPSAISFLITEAGWLIAGWVITRPSVQLAMAEWFHGNLIGVLLGVVGTTVVGAATLLDAAFDGQYGTGALRDSLGFGRKDPEAAPEGEFTSSSEWAKIVFHGLLFPPGQEQQLVPYIGPEQRATLLRQTMGLTGEPQGRGNGAAEVDRRRADAATSEPGMPVNPDARTGPQ
jgi:hypothetical protein